MRSSSSIPPLGAEARLVWVQRLAGSERFQAEVIDGGCGGYHRRLEFNLHQGHVHHASEICMRMRMHGDCLSG